MKKIKIGQLYFICWSIFFALMFLVMIFHIENLAFCAVAGAMILLLLCIVFNKYREGINKLVSKPWPYIALLVLMMAGLLFFAGEMIIHPFTDYGSIWFSVADIVESGSISRDIKPTTSWEWTIPTSYHDYLLMYPNSRFMVEFLLPFGYFLKNTVNTRLRTDTAYYFLGSLNACFILAGVVFIVLAARRERGNRAAFLVLLGSLLFMPYYLNAYRIYSDTLSIPFVGLALWMMTEADHAEKNAWWLRALAGGSMGLGILFKGSIWILVIASVIYILIKRKTWNLRGKEVLCLLLPVIMVTQLWGACLDNLPWLDTTQSDRYKMPTMHWLMMASHKEGGFNMEDLEYSLSFETLEERTEAAKERYIENVKKQGLVRYTIFTVKKVVYTFSDGLYCQQGHLNRFNDRWIGSLTHQDGAFYGILKLYTSTTLCFIYLTILISGILNAKRKTCLELLLAVCMFGLVLFFSFWETKSRYLLNFTPMFLLMSALSVDDLIQIFAKHTGFRKRICNENQPDTDHTRDIVATESAAIDSEQTSE